MCYSRINHHCVVKRTAYSPPDRELFFTKNVNAL